MKIRQSLNDNLLKLKDKAAMGKLNRLTVEIEETDFRKLKSKAAMDGVKMSDILRKLVKEHV